MKARRCHVILGPSLTSNLLIKHGSGRNENSGREYQQQEYGEEKQVNAALQDVRFATGKGDHAHGQC
jgi:hypothetical protein